ncbi:hypothetical protein C2E23DRAFT_853438 [Lenzites betulinus]|nr:hypothetical protein C2E23DRAFT_853438 [Lenzites betulinus]
MPEGTVLTPDVLYNIMDVLSDDRPTVYACALSAKAFLPGARANLYRDIKLSRDALQKAKLLSRTLAADPALGSLVRSLHMSRVYSTPETRKIYLALPDVLPFHYFTELRSLSLHLLEIFYFEDIVAVLALLPQLKYLECYMIHWHSNVPAVVHTAPGTGAHAQDAEHPSFPSLENIAIKHGTWAANKFAERLLARQQSVSSLRDIDVSFGRVADLALAWVPVIRKSGACVQSVSISLTNRSTHHATKPLSPADRALYPSDYAYALDNIAHCPSLRTLTLKYFPGRQVEYTSPGILEALCDTLARGRTAPWPALEHLIIFMLDREGRAVAPPPAACTRLAALLSSRARFPRLVALTVQIRLEAQNGNRGSHDPQVVRERWRALFGEYGRADSAAIQLNVQVLLMPRPRTGVGAWT